MADPFTDLDPTSDALAHVTAAAGPYLDSLAGLLTDGRVFAGATVYDGRVALRPASSTGAPPRPTSTCSSPWCASWPSSEAW